MTCKHYDEHSIVISCESSWNECHTSVRDETQELVTGYSKSQESAFHGKVVYICVLLQPCAISELLDNISYQHQSYALTVLRYWYLKPFSHKLQQSSDSQFLGGINSRITRKTIKEYLIDNLSVRISWKSPPEHFQYLRELAFRTSISYMNFVLENVRGGNGKL